MCPSTTCYDARFECFDLARTDARHVRVYVHRCNPHFLVSNLFLSLNLVYLNNLTFGLWDSSVLILS